METTEPAICPFMSDAEHQVECTARCALSLRRDEEIYCALTQTYFSLEDVKALVWKQSLRDENLFDMGI